MVALNFFLIFFKKIGDCVVVYIPYKTGWVGKKIWKKKGEEVLLAHL
jgi:hypothetical protein